MARTLWIGMDVGSTTVKIAVLVPETTELLHTRYVRHNTRPAETVKSLLTEAHGMFPDAEFKVCFCGSAGQSFAKALDAFFVQEVIANTLVIKHDYPQVRTAVELGGQDAKVVFFRYDESAKQLTTSDMRMNGSCAGGTGAFIDQVAELLGVKTENFEALASKGKTLYNISGRCGVFAKTDIQPLLNQGVAKEDIALSSLHAIAKQTIGGLAQGMEIKAPVIFEGGPNTFIPTLVRAFRERLDLKDEGDAILPKGAETLIARGAALAVGMLHAGEECGYRGLASFEGYEKRLAESETESPTGRLFFENDEERAAFEKRHAPKPFVRKTFPAGTVVEAWLGIDAGSTTSKFVLLDDEGTVLDRFYANNGGDPLRTVQAALLAMRKRYADEGVELSIRGAGTTGYGELMFAKAFHADYHTVETVAHAEAAQHEHPDVSFILDIGGQDMKAIHVGNGIVTGIVLNEACSAGCGSFVETYSRSLGIPVGDIAEMAFHAKKPSQLGSRCTVFMNSSIITEQKNGKATEDIMAGICRSIVENVFTKVLRLPNLDVLGDVVVVQGGTFKNDAVLRAFEQYTGKSVIRPEFPGEMGAIGVALLTRKHVLAHEARYGRKASSFISWKELESFSYEERPGLVCPFCQNSCKRTQVLFADGTVFVTGNRCERGEIMGDPKDPAVRKQAAEATRRMDAVPDMVKVHNALLTKDWMAELKMEPLDGKRNIKIGLPRVLEFWNSMPYWKTIFATLGFDVVVSRRSDVALFEKGLSSIPSDTACFPAKLVHGHVQDLIERGVDRIFMPMMITQPSENKSIQGKAFCAMIQGYPMVVDRSDDPLGRHDVAFDHPVFHWDTLALKYRQTASWLENSFGVPSDMAKAAVKQGTRALKAFRDALHRESAKALTELEKTDGFGVVLAARPYHSDLLVNHGLSSLFTAQGVPVFVLDGLDIDLEDLSDVRMDTINSFHARVLAAAKFAARHPRLELTQIVSFGCGHEATLTDEMKRVYKSLCDKEALVVKLDEGEVKGPLNIRVKSFVETVRVQREKALLSGIKTPGEPYPVKFTEADKEKRSILVPNLSPSFSLLCCKVFEKEGYKAVLMPLANRRAIELGKKFVHNDICFPAQVNIGEALAFLEQGRFKPDEIAVGLAKNCEHCRAGQYAMLARKALDEAGYPTVPVVTTGSDDKDMHPGFKLSATWQIRMAWGIVMMDAMEFMIRAVRPYELTPGAANRVHWQCLEHMMTALKTSRKRALLWLRAAVRAFNAIPVDRSVRRPRVAVLGEILMKYHPTANGEIEKYLESQGMEVVQPPMLDFFRMSDVVSREKLERGFSSSPFMMDMMMRINESVFVSARKAVDAIMKEFKFYSPFPSSEDLARLTAPFIDPTYAAGEAWLIPAEILHQAHKGVRAFVILNPFGCLPNHITGRGMTKTLKSLVPDAQILSLDYDPDISPANIENRLQMLIIATKELEQRRREAATA